MKTLLEETNKETIETILDQCMPWGFKAQKSTDLTPGVRRESPKQRAQMEPKMENS
jgi:hypothetical protein